jgi:hypothetical protein
MFSALMGKVDLEDGVADGKRSRRRPPAPRGVRCNWCKGVN